MEGMTMGQLAGASPIPPHPASNEMTSPDIDMTTTDLVSRSAFPSILVGRPPRDVVQESTY